MSHSIKKLKLINFWCPALFLMCMMNLFFMHFIVGWTKLVVFDVTSLIDNSLGVYIDTCFIFMLTLLCTCGKLKKSLLLTFILTIFISFSNILYSHFFSSYIGLSSIKQIDSLFDRLVLNSTLEGIDTINVFFLVIIPFFLYFLRKCPITLNMKSIKIFFITLICFIIFDLACHFAVCVITPEYRYFSYYSNRVISRHFSNRVIVCHPELSAFYRGILRSIVGEVYKDMQGPLDLSEDQMALILKMQQNTVSSMSKIHNTTIDNVIFLLVESYMSFTSDLFIDGKEITPFLNSLKHDSLVYYNGNMKSNITLGESSDGQYIYMTGMLPLRSVITVSKACNSKLPSLAHVMINRGMKTRMVIPTLPTIWSQDQMCRQYGFNRLYSSNDYEGNHDIYLSDKQVFNLAKKLDKESTSPFFSMILTLSMHQPYKSIIDPSFVINDRSIPSDLKNYLNACHYTDAQIANYFKHLKDHGLFDKSLIIIASDHDIRSANFGDELNNNIPLYVINGNLNSFNGWQGSCNQLDVYTTILDILGEYDYWCGLGNSLISSSYNNSVTDLTWEVSELLLLSRFFENKEIIK